ncbi:nucleotide pyrophosphohydrolase [Chryseobacterium angstadtii]|uniref:Nucleotide pyrophosphohydrolase n=1 Tax=Chryseobacterium angstadtii TaxID=558151 RepID=A0A0J7IDG9_9FLAO|nr:nucleotide pyrophosphohydrolase [Chryseobacterium angstadtii]KMQ64503.1 nucleotide pyrophosphohydrolase [Chryseobacterium angstadtii]
MIDTETLQKLLKFRDDRDWEQFHNSKDLALALSIEASELLEVFLWKKEEDFSRDKLEEELADVFMYGLLLAHKNNVDINSIILRKLQKNDEKYPVNKAKGKADKYDEL